MKIIDHNAEENLRKDIKASFVLTMASRLNRLYENIKHPFWVWFGGAILFSIIISLVWKHGEDVGYVIMSCVGFPALAFGLFVAYIHIAETRRLNALAIKYNLLRPEVQEIAQEELS